MSWEVYYFQTKRGTYPVKEFIKEQNILTQARITKSIELLSHKGPFLKPPYIKKLQNKLYELRISGKDTFRLFYTIINAEYYILHAFKKKSQKTPVRELKIAIDRMRGMI